MKTQVLVKSRIAFPGLRTSPAVAILVLLLGSPVTSQALIPEPDNILYGTITLDGLMVTATQTNVVVEARRTANGPAIASYRMGADAQVGSFYSLKIPNESLSPMSDAAATPTGDVLFITLQDGSGLRGQTNYTVQERGSVARVDFGTAVFDSDGDLLPDAWELQYANNLSWAATNLTANGQTVLQHYIAGTNPNDPQGGFRLQINETNALKRVWFVAARAEGPGYEGKARRYTLEFRANPNAGSWTELAGYVNVVGSNQTVNYFTPGMGSPGFYRTRISLADLPVGDSAIIGPILALTPSGVAEVTVSWSPNAPGFVLQETWNLAAGDWTNSPSGAANPVVVPALAPEKFYRLIQP
jgi:hypothetical protein